MVEIEFIYNQIKIINQCNLNDKMKDIFIKFAIKLDKKPDEIYFLYNGTIIKDELTLNEIINSEDIQKNKIKILVNDINHENELEEEEDCFKPSKNIICPNCKENIRISIHDYKIKLYECKNNHLTDNISFNQFENTQLINEKKIICEKCKKSNKNDTYEKKFYRCLPCKINLCPLCKISHDKNHNIIDYEQKDFICDLHYEVYNSYCKDCLKNICIICENEHLDHNIISFGRIMPNIKAINDEINSQRKKISQFINEIEEIINKLNNLIDNIEIYYKIYDNIINNYEIKNRNFSILQNIIDISNYNNNFYKTINKIIDEKNIVNKFSYLIDIYDKMNLKNKNSNNVNIEIKNSNLNNNKINNNIINKKNIINNNIDEKKDLVLSKSDKDLNNIKEEKIDNFKNFDVTQLKVKDSYKINNKIKIIYKLKDENIAIIDDKNEFYIFNLKDKINYVFSVKLNLNNAIYNMIQLDDGNLIISDNYIHLYKLNKNGIENIETPKIRSSRIYKLSKEKLIIYDEPKINLYSYENNKIIDQKYSFEILELKSKSNIIYDLFNAYTYSYLNDLLVINENEILICYTYVGLGDDNFTHYFIFYDVKKGKKIDSLKIGNNDYKISFCLFDKNYLIASYYKKLFLIDLNRHSTIKTISLDNNVNYSFSIISLNENFILVSTDEKDANYISQYEIENHKKIKFKFKKKPIGKYEFIGKCNGNELIIKKFDKNILIYNFK